MSFLRQVAAVGVFAVMGTLSLGCGHARLQPATAEGRSEMARLAKAVADGTADANAPLALREAGPDGLAALLLELDAAPTDAARVARLRPAIDQVAKQKDAHVSRLYWYTDLDQAKAAAHDTSRPILSLRLLGNLDDELSCANSRFFRTTLYSNVDVATYLRDHFVLHWSSERPAPVMTIDFRDGRKIQRTITGNSIHYVLDEAGRPLDAIPGLYGPAPFITALAKVVDLDQRTHKMSASDRDAAVAMYHTAELTRLTAQWRSMLVGAGVTDPALFALPAPPPAGNVPAATIAAPLAYAKAAVEMPMVRAVMPSMELPDDKLPWSRLTATFAGTAKLDASARALVRAKNPMDWSNQDGPRPLDDAAFDALILSFEKLMVEDGTRNEFKNHAKLHEWLLASPDMSWKDLDKRVYSELFLTPKSDPWLGLVPPGVYSGIENDGIVSPPK
jgi:hypothetical protein